MARSEIEEQAIIKAREKVAKQKARQGLLVPKMEQIGKKTKKNQVLRNVSEGEERFSQIFEGENPLKFIEENASAIKEFLSEAPSQRSQASKDRRKVINIDNKSKFLNDLIREVELDEEKLSKIFAADIGLDDNDKKLLSQSLKEENKALCSDQDLTTLEKVSLVQVLEYERGETNNLDERSTALNNLMSSPSFDYDKLQKISGMDLGLDDLEKKLLEFSVHPKKKIICSDQELTNKQKLAFLAIESYRKGELEEANQIKALAGGSVTKPNIENGILNTDLDKLAIKFAGKKINFIKLIEDSSPEVGDRILQLSEKVAKVEKSPTKYWKKLVVNFREFCSKGKVTDVGIQDYIIKDKNVAKIAEKMQTSLMAKRNNINVPGNNIGVRKEKSSQQGFSI